MVLDLKTKKILVTGGAGFLGTHLVRALINRGVDKNDIVVPKAAEHDLRKAEVCRDVMKGIDIVIHLAGTTGDGQFHKEHQAEILFDNLTMGVELMEAARQSGVKKFLVAGSVTEYPAQTPPPLREEQIWSGQVEDLHKAYAVAKLMLLAQGQAYRAQYGMDVIHLLLANMYGPGKEPARGFVITNVIRNILEARRTKATSITLWGTGKPTRDFIFVKDAAEAFILAAERYDKPDPVNIGSGREISIYDLANLIARLMDFKGEIRWDSSKPDGQPRRQLDVSRAEREFGFQAKTPFEVGLRETIEWHEKQINSGS